MSTQMHLASQKRKSVLWKKCQAISVVLSRYLTSRKRDTKRSYLMMRIALTSGIRSKCSISLLDERTAKEKLSNVYYLVNASTSKVALNNTIEYLGQGMADYKIASVVETKIFDVFEHKEK